MSKLPKWAKSGQGQWEYKGQKRPGFAVEPKEGEESVWDYPRPPALVPDKRNVLVKYKDTVIAESTNIYRVLETASPPTVYVPTADVNKAILSTSNRNTRCEWKGIATYWNLIAKDGKPLIQDVGWSYGQPFDRFKQMAGYLCFYPNKVDCILDNERVRPQPGGYYGGWLTDEIVGPVKGESNKTYL